MNRWQCRRFDGRKKFKVYEKGGTLRVSLQDVKNVQQAKEALESVVGPTVAA